MLTPDGSMPDGRHRPDAGDRHLERGEPPQGARARRPQGRPRSESGPWVQVSRLGNPLFNEVIIPLGKKDDWNREHPA